MSRRLCGGGLCDYCVSPSPFGLDFGTSDLGLTKVKTFDSVLCPVFSHINGIQVHQLKVHVYVDLIS